MACKAAVGIGGAELDENDLGLIIRPPVVPVLISCLLVAALQV